LQKLFPEEVSEIYGILGKFREGLNSFDFLNTNGKGYSTFSHVLHFLQMKEAKIEISFLPEDEIQKVIFDKEYVKYLKNKIQYEDDSQKGANNRLKFVQYECIKSELSEEF